MPNKSFNPDKQSKRRHDAPKESGHNSFKAANIRGHTAATKKTSALIKKAKKK